MRGGPTRLEDYADALRRYLDGSMPGEEFRRQWSRLNSGERELRGEPWDSRLDDFFMTVERFQPDPELRAELLADEPGAYIGDDEFKPLAAAFLRSLEGRP